MELFFIVSNYDYAHFKGYNAEQFRLDTINVITFYIFLVLINVIFINIQVHVFFI